MEGVSNGTFGNYIDYNTLAGDTEGFDSYEPNKDLASLLFSKKNLETEMKIGFVGNPNIGSVVLNQFKESEEFRQFAANFSPNDRIFIISSIFGGTGAAGFPIILKNIRGAEAGDLDNSEFLRNAKIGALTALPYFSLESNDDKKVDKATFYSKTKAALNYYGRGVNKSVNRLYYIGDELTETYAYDSGENGQKNNAHFVELASALAIVDFAATPDNKLENDGGIPTETVYKEFGIRADANTLHFAHLGADTLEIICRALSKMTLLNLYIEHRLGEVVGGNMAWLKESPTIDKGFTGESFYKILLVDFKKAYFEWLNEMAENKRGFKPFQLTSDLAQLISGVIPKRSLFSILVSKTDFPAFDEALNKFCKGQQFSSAEDKFLKAIGSGSDAFLTDKFSDLFKNL